MSSAVLLPGLHFLNTPGIYQPILLENRFENKIAKKRADRQIRSLEGFR
jgi:hypothetical protein